MSKDWKAEPWVLTRRARVPVLSVVVLAHVTQSQLSWPSNSVLLICRLLRLGSLWDPASSQPVIQGLGCAGCSSGLPACWVAVAHWAVMGRTHRLPLSLSDKPSLYLALILVGSLVLYMTSTWHCTHREIKGPLVDRLSFLCPFQSRAARARLGPMEGWKAALEVCCWEMSRQV